MTTILQRPSELGLPCPIWVRRGGGVDGVGGCVRGDVTSIQHQTTNYKWQGVESIQKVNNFTYDLRQRSIFEYTWQEKKIRTVTRHIVSSHGVWSNTVKVRDENIENMFKLQSKHFSLSLFSCQVFSNNDRWRRSKGKLLTSWVESTSCHV